MRWRPVDAVFKRFFYTSIHSPPLLVDLLLWPAVDLLVWGLLTVFIRQQDVALPLPIGFLIGGVLLWDLLFRSNLGVAMTFLDDAAWSRNALNVLVAPITATEYLAGAVLWALFKIAIGWTLMVALAWALFSFSILSVGVALAVFGLALMLFGLVLALLVLGLLLRFGHGADILAWGIAMGISPLCAVYYPLEVLPGWARAVSMALPPSHVFEGMRTILAGGAAPWESVTLALGLDVLYLGLAVAFARAMYASLRRRGLVTRYM